MCGPRLKNRWRRRQTLAVCVLRSRHNFQGDGGSCVIDFEVLARIDVQAVYGGKFPVHGAASENFKRAADRRNETLDQLDVQSAVQTCTIGNRELAILSAYLHAANEDVQNSVCVLRVCSGDGENARLGG